MGWWQRVFGGGRPEVEQPVAVPAPPTTEQIVTSVDAVLARASGKAPAAVTARVQRVVETVHEMVPRLDRLGPGSQQACDPAHLWRLPEPLLTQAAQLVPRSSDPLATSVVSARLTRSR